MEKEGEYVKETEHIKRSKISLDKCLSVALNAEFSIAGVFVCLFVSFLLLFCFFYFFNFWLSFLMDTKAPECYVLFSWIFMHITYSAMLNECMYYYEVCLTAKENPGVMCLGKAL